MTQPPTRFKTVHAASSADTFIKPGELIDVVELTPLTLQDRRIYNMLLANAWDSIEEDKAHVIAKKELRGSHSVNDRVGESIERLMGALVKVKTTSNTGKNAVMRIQLLAPNTEETSSEGLLYYRFPAELRQIVRESLVFARLRKTIMYSFTSKYALALYEMLQKRGQMKYKSYEEFTIEEMRALLGVPKDKLKGFRNFHAWALKPAAQEVGFLSDYRLTLEPIRNGRTVTKIRLTWEPKDKEALQDVIREHAYSKTGRKTRREAILAEFSMTKPAKATPFPISIEAFEKAKEIAIKAGTGWDIYAIEKQFYAYAAKKGQPDNPDGAFVSFAQKKVLEQA